jgi:hypothetical protein
MPIFQAATSGYRDPLKAMTIKALEERQKATALATAKSAEPETIANPMMGMAHIANILGSQMDEGRAASALSGNRQALAQVMAGINQDTGPTSEQLAQVAQYDPDLGNKMYEEAMRTRREAAAAQAQRDFQHQENIDTRTGQAALQDDQQQAQADAARISAENAVKTATTLNERQAAEKRLEEINTEQAKIADDKRASDEAQRKEALPQTNSGKIEQDFKNGAYGDPATPEAQKLRDAALAKENTVTGGFGGPAGIKAVQDLRSKGNVIDTGLDNMDEAERLVPNVLQGELAVKAMDVMASGGSLGLDFMKWASEKAGHPISQQQIEATQRYFQIMDLNALTQMSTTLAGSDSDRDVQTFKNILASRNSTPDQKLTAIRQLRKSLEGDRVNTNASLIATGQGGLNERKPRGDTSTADAGTGTGTSSAAPATAAEPPVYDPKLDQEGDTGTDDAGNKWVVRGGKWVKA